MSRYDKITPEGTKDLLFEESKAMRNVEESLRALFEKKSFTEVVTPGFEFFDVFNAKSAYFPQESMYSLPQHRAPFGSAAGFHDPHRPPDGDKAQWMPRADPALLRHRNSVNFLLTRPERRDHSDGIELIGSSSFSSDRKSSIRRAGKSSAAALGISDWKSDISVF
jgi:ATP phosphoribosyltransferase regulatory subunit